MCDPHLKKKTVICIKIKGCALNVIEKKNTQLTWNRFNMVNSVCWDEAAAVCTLL